MKLNKGFLLVDIVVGLAIAIALVLALVGYLNRIVHYHRATEFLERGVCVGVQALDNRLRGESYASVAPFSITWSSHPVFGSYMHVSWQEGEKERTLVLRSVSDAG